jgi:molybdopterin converting factor small subunit
VAPGHTAEEKGTPLQIQVLYFGALRDRLATSAEAVTVAHGTSVDSLVDQLSDLHPGLASVRSHVRVAVNEEFAPSGRLLQYRRVAFTSYI